jgi:hypothetical protein
MWMNLRPRDTSKNNSTGAIVNEQAKLIAPVGLRCDGVQVDRSISFEGSRRLMSRLAVPTNQRLTLIDDPLFRLASSPLFVL